MVLLAPENRSTRSAAHSELRHRFADHRLAGLNHRPRATKAPNFGQALLNQTKTWFLILQGQSPSGASFTTIPQLQKHIDAFIAA
jgi:hypothetical protein